MNLGKFFILSQFFFYRLGDRTFKKIIFTLYAPLQFHIMWRCLLQFIQVIVTERVQERRFGFESPIPVMLVKAQRLDGFKRLYLFIEKGKGSRKESRTLPRLC